MTFQKTVRLVSGLGVPGEILLHGPKRAGAYVLGSPDGVKNTIGCVFTFDASKAGIVRAGATTAGAAFAGILANPKVYAYRGTLLDSGSADDRMSLPNGIVGEFVTMGEVLVTVDKSAKVGDYLAYKLADGTLTVVAAPANGSVPSAPNGYYAIVPNCRVSRFPQNDATGGLVVACLTN